MEKNKISKEKYKKSHPWYSIIKGLRQRCNNKNSNRYHRYGGRGIKALLTIDEIKYLWERDKASEMKQPSIDRIDNDCHYELSNCRFIEMSENSAKGNTETHSKSILQFDLNGVLIAEYKSITKASQILNCNIQTISKCLNNKCKTVKGYIFKFKKDYKDINFLISYKEHKSKCKKVVLQYDLEGKFIKEWDSAKEIEKALNFLHQNISKCCLKKSKTAYGFIWKFKPKDLDK